MNNYLIILLSIVTFIITLLNAETGDGIVILMVGIFAFIGIIIGLIGIVRGVDVFDL